MRLGRSSGAIDNLWVWSRTDFGPPQPTCGLSDAFQYFVYRSARVFRGQTSDSRSRVLEAAHTCAELALEVRLAFQT